MDALDVVAKAATSGKSLKRRNMMWLVATGILDILALSVVALHTPLDSLTSRIAVIRSSLTVLPQMPIRLLLYLIPNNQREELVFWRWRNSLPGSRAFSKHAPTDPRIAFSALKKMLAHSQKKRKSRTPLGTAYISWSNQM